MYHLNREIKRVKKSSSSKLSKIVSNKRVVVEEREEVSQIVVDNFSSLF